jgi:hypothetical protein
MDPEVDPRRSRCRNIGRQVIFLQKDVAIFSEALRQEFPRVRFFDHVLEKGGIHTWREVPSLVASREPSLSIVFPEYIGPIEIAEEFAQDRTWLEEQGSPAHRSMTYWHGDWEWEETPKSFYRDRLSYDPPTPCPGAVNAHYYPNDPWHKMHLSIIKRVWKVMSRMSIGKLKGGTPLTNMLNFGSDVVLMKGQRHGNPWVGHWALQWCRDGEAAGERRRLWCNFRPCDDWEMPTDPKYQALCRLVEEKYGKDFGGPPTEPKRWRAYHAAARNAPE